MHTTETSRFCSCGEVACMNGKCINCLKKEQKIIPSTIIIRKTETCALCGDTHVIRYGLCKKCLSRFYRCNGGYFQPLDLSEASSKKMQREYDMCDTLGCFNYTQKNGKCTVHRVERNSTRKANVGKRCGVPGCKFDAEIKGLCNMHYRYIKYHNINMDEAPLWNHLNFCSEPGCNRIGYGEHNLCLQHHKHPGVPIQQRKFINEKIIYQVNDILFGVPLPISGTWSLVFQDHDGKKEVLKVFKDLTNLFRYVGRNKVREIHMADLISEYYTGRKMVCNTL